MDQQSSTIGADFFIFDFRFSTPKFRCHYAYSCKSFHIIILWSFRIRKAVGRTNVGTRNHDVKIHGVSATLANFRSFRAWFQLRHDLVTFLVKCIFKTVSYLLRAVCKRENNRNLRNLVEMTYAVVKSWSCIMTIHDPPCIFSPCSQYTVRIKNSPTQKK